MTGTDRPSGKSQGQNKCSKQTWIPYPLPVVEVGTPIPSPMCVLRAKLLQPCLTLCKPMNCSPPGSSVPADSLGKNTGVGCHYFLQGIFFTQGLSLRSLCLLHWQAGSLPLVPPGKSTITYNIRQKSWVFIGRTDVEAETPILWPPHAKS